MNFRITSLFFALLLTMLWVFGLMIAHKKSAGDQGLVLPKLQAQDVKIEKIVVKSSKAKDGLDAEFVLIGDQWFLQQDKQKVRVEGFRIDNIVKQIKAAKHDETADVSKDPANYGLKDPKTVVTLEGKFKGDDKKWEFLIGNESAGMIYVTEGERRDKIFAVPKKSIEGLFMKDPNHLRSRRIFDFVETGVTAIAAKDTKNELELQRVETNWKFIKPPLGLAGNESEPDEKKKDPHKNPLKEAPAPVAGGVKGFLSSIIAIRVDEETDFEPLGKDLSSFALGKGDESMRIEISSAHEGKATSETLFIGKKVPERIGDFWYAKLESDDGVMQINKKWLEPIAKALAKPGDLRSRDVSIFDKKLVDAILIKEGKGKNETLLFKSEGEAPKFQMPGQEPAEQWSMIVSAKEKEKEKEKKKASDAAVNALIEQMLGKKAIVEFYKGNEDEQKKEEAKWGLDASGAEVSIFTNGLDKEKKKDDTKKENLPMLKKDYPAEVTLAIGKVDGEVVHIRRTLKDGSVTRFTMKKEFQEKALPAEGIELAYVDTALPAFSPEDAVALKLHRVTTKAADPLELVHRGVDGKMYWYLKDKEGLKPADAKNAEFVVALVSQMRAQKWLKKLDAKEDLEVYGLAKPAMTVEITVKNTPGAAADLIGKLALPRSLVTAAVGVLYQQEWDPGEIITLKIGKETDKEKDKPGVYATHSGSKMLFLMPAEFVKLIKDKDLHDRSAILYSQVGMEALSRANAALDPTSIWMFASPYFTGTIHQIDPENVTDVRLTVRTPFELRAFVFGSKEKEKPKEEKKTDDKDKEKEKGPKRTWTDKSGLQEFQLDPEKVAALVKDFAKLRTERFAAFAGGAQSEHKLDTKDASVVLEFTTVDKTTITLTIGAAYLNHGYFAKSSAWPDVVFFVPSTAVDPLLQGVRHFAKERSQAN